MINGKKILFYFLFYLTTFFLSATPLFFTYNFRIDSLASQIIKNNTGKPTVLSIKSNNQQYNSKLIPSLYYNMFVDNIRYSIDERCFVNNYEIHLEVQDRFYIREETLPDGSYYLDYGLYSAYYSDKELINRSYSGCDGFILVSDTFANKLISNCNITSEEPYKELVKKEEYGVVELKIGAKVFKYRITNVLHSDCRNGPRTKELYSDFGLIYSLNVDKHSLFTSFEIDLKNNNRCIRQSFELLNALDCDITNSSFTFSEYNNQQHNYVENTNLLASFVKAYSLKNNNTLFFALFYTALFLFSILNSVYIVLSPFKNEILIVTFSSFLIYGFLSIFLQPYPLLSLFPLLSVLISSIICYKQLRRFFINRYEKSLVFVKAIQKKFLRFKAK